MSVHAIDASVMATDAPLDASNGTLITAALVGIGVVVVLITWLKVHPFLALILGTGVLGVVAGLGLTDTIASFQAGVGSTVGNVGLLIALGSMIGGLLAESGGADRIVDAVVDTVSEHRLPWAMAGVAALIGLPLFFEVGVVLLVPVVLLVSRRSGINVLKIGIPALAGLSVLHGLVPPHPGPLVAIDAVGADLGTTLFFGILIAIPTVIIAGPVFGAIISRYIVIDAPRSLLPVHEPIGARTTSGGAASNATSAQQAAYTGPGEDDVRASAPEATPPPTTGFARPDLVPTVLTILLPVALMLLRAIAEIVIDEGNRVRDVLVLLGSPVIALLLGVLMAMFTLGARVGMNRGQISTSVGGALPGIAGILLIVAAGGGFKQTLIDVGVGDMVGSFAEDANINALFLGWLVAVGIRLATGSATVATITAAGIVAPLAADLDKPSVALLALAIGAGSLFFSHVNDAGFWLVKEYFGLTVGQTLASWSVMETIISVVGLVLVLLLSIVV